MVSTLAVLGDSQSCGTSPAGVSIAQSGTGNWVELTAERLANLPGVGPLLSSGLRGIWLATLADGDGTWSLTSGGNAWTAVTSSDAWDRLFGHGRYGSGINKVATATLPRTYRTAVAFEPYFFDYAVGGDWQYRVNGGTWTNMGQTLAHDNRLAKFRVTATLVPGSTVEFRCYDGSADCGCALAGIEWVYSTATTGLVVHNLGQNGWKLAAAAASGSGDRLAFFDSVKLGTGGPLSPTPNRGVVAMFINDVLDANTTSWSALHTTLHARVSPLGPVAFINPWGCSTATYNDTQQTNYRAQTKTDAAALVPPAKVLDVFDAWSAIGYGSTNATQSAGAVTQGLLNADGVHPEQAGHLDLVNRTYWFIRTQFFNFGAASSAFGVGQSPLGATDVLGGLAYTVMGNRASETDTANAGTPLITVVGARATETDTAGAGSPVITAPGARATETDTPNAGTPLVTVSGALALESDAALAGAPAFTQAGSQATETDTANAGSIVVTIGGTQALEVDTANEGDVVTDGGIVGSRAQETDIARAGTPLAVIIGAQALEVDTAHAGSATIPGPSRDLVWSVVLASPKWRASGPTSKWTVGACRQ